MEITLPKRTGATLKALLTLMFAAELAVAQTGPNLWGYRPEGAARGPARPAGLRNADPLREAKFVPAARASFMTDTDLVLGYRDGGVARAYLTVAVVFHHIIDDQLSQLPIMATW